MKTRAAAAECRLVDLSVGHHAWVVSVGGGDSRLASHGFRPGAGLSVESDAPFRGPRIVRLGSARVAIAREIARRVVVRPDPDAASGR